MSLKLKRNIPLFVLLLTIITSLAIMIGNQPIIAY